MGIALGRKAWLFAGSDRGGQRAAVMFTLIHTAKLNDVDPQAWLADVPGPDRRSQDQRPGCAVAVELAPPHPYRPRRLIMAAPASAVTISRAAELLGEDEELLWRLVDAIEPEDGCLWIHGTPTNRPSPSLIADSNICRNIRVH
jgi:hypothetical protein